MGKPRDLSDGEKFSILMVIAFILGMSGVLGFLGTIIWAIVEVVSHYV